MHPALDPDAGALVDRSNFFTIQIQRERRVLGIIATRLYSGRLVDLLHTRALWARETPSLEDLEPMPIVSLAAHRIEGRISLQGGMIIDPEARGLGLSNHLMWLVRLACFRHWLEDWQVGLITEETHAKNIHIPKFGYHGAEVLFQGGADPGPAHETEILVYAQAGRFVSDLSLPMVSPDRRISTTDTIRSSTGRTSRRK